MSIVNDCMFFVSCSDADVVPGLLSFDEGTYEEHTESSSMVNGSEEM